MTLSPWVLLAAVVPTVLSWPNWLDQTPALANGRSSKLTRDLFGFHKNLTQIESITGNENAVGQWLAESLHSQGYHIEKQHVSKDPPRFNVLAWPGAKRDAQVLLSSHIDTVPPFYPYHRDNSTTNKTISGRGSVDAKASVATQILAVNQLLDAGTINADDVALLYVVGEETGGDGMRAANNLGLSPKTIIFGEPTEGKLAAGHKGMLGVKLTAKGKAAHSGYPWLGRSANEILITALAALLKLGDDLPGSDKFGRTTINVGRIEGGVAANVVAESATAQIAIRIAAGTPAWLKGQITQVLNAAISDFLDEGLEAEDILDILFTSEGYAPINLDHDIPGFGVITVNYGTDVPNLNKTVDGQQRYLYGPGSILVAHSDHEMLTEGQLEEALTGYAKIILHALGKGQAGVLQFHGDDL